MVWSLTIALLAGLLVSVTQRHLCRELDDYFGKRTEGCRGALLVIAHPDDESMFFSPTLQYLTGRGIHLEVLCLSSGNAEGLGEVRTEELYRSLGYVYGIKPSAMTVLNSERMQDGIDMLWDEDDVQRTIDKHVRAREGLIGIVISFDEIGVSGHRNHISTHRGLEQARKVWANELLSRRNDDGGNIEEDEETVLWQLPDMVWYLESVGIWRKYSGFVDLVTSTLIAKLQAVNIQTIAIPFTNFGSVWRGMLCHQTQLEWYRYLFVALSRYSYMNTVHVVQVINE